MISRANLPGQPFAQIYASELSRIRGIAPARLNTFSNANRTRNLEVVEKFFWHVYEKLKDAMELSSIASRQVFPMGW